MQQELLHAFDRLGVTDQVPTLVEAARHSEETLQAAKRHIHRAVPLERGTQLDVIVHGSFARGEATTQSDFDYLVVAHELSEDVTVMQDILRAVDDFVVTELRGGSGEGGGRPGATGLFGHIASAPGLTERIGLEQDTNVSTTRRLLVLEESASIYQPERRAKLLRAVLARYLVDYPGSRKEGVPRFLLNDVIRYWYTLAVDYQAKRWEGDDRGWGLRYLKLLLSRKLVYAATVVTLLRCDKQRPATVDRLAEEFDKAPLVRLIELLDDEQFEGREDLEEIVLIAERFAAFLADAELREKAKVAPAPDGLDTDPRLREMLEAAASLHRALERLLFDSFLAPTARRYLVF